jgi:hypothetical protein
MQEMGAAKLPSCQRFRKGRVGGFFIRRMSLLDAGPALGKEATIPSKP